MTEAESISDRVNVVVDAVRRQRAGGNNIDKEVLSALPAELRPRVEEELRRLALVEAAQIRAGESPTMTNSIDPTPPTFAADPAAETSRRRLPNITGYRVENEIGGGGQASVYRAIQLSTGQKVAVKILHSRELASDSDRARFDREARVLAALNHPNIVSIVDRGETAEGMLFLVMAYIDGIALDKFLFKNRPNTVPLPPQDRLRLFMQIADAVNVAHLRGVAHRDLKPSNILVDERGEPHLLDFGLARIGIDRGGDSISPLSITGNFLGSLPWASPEQAEGKPDKIDIRTDVYSLGVILYQMLTGGQFPYVVVGNMRDVLDNILNAEPTPPSTLLAASEAKAEQKKRRWLKAIPAVNPVIEAIVLKSLAKKPLERYQSAGELARDIGNYLSGLPTAVPILRKRSTITLTSKLSGLTSWHLRRLALIVILSAAITTAACGAYYWITFEIYVHQMSSKSAVSK